MYRKRKSIALLVTVIMLFSVFIGGCGKSSVDKSQNERTLKVALPGDINALDPAFAYDRVTNAVVLQITEGLFYYDRNNQIVPWLAKSYKILDPTTYVYEIRDDVYFSDKTPMTVDDVIFSLERYRDPATASDLAWMFANVDTIAKTGDWQVTVKLKKPDALWAQALATTAGHVISKKYYEAHKDAFGKPDGGLLGTGPFIFEKWTTGSQIELVKNPNYWDKNSRNQIDRIVYKIIPDGTARVAALTAEQVDFINNPPFDTIDQIKASDNAKLSEINTFYVRCLIFNTERKPFDDVNVRKAVYHAIDRDSIYKNIFKDTVAPSNSLPVEESICSGSKEAWSDYLKNAPDYKYNLAKAREYLAKSSVPNGFQTTIILEDDSAYNAAALSIQQSLQKLNIKADIVKLSSSEYFSYQFGGKIKDGKRDYDMLFGRWLSDFPDPAGTLVPLYASANKGKGGSNAAAYSNAKVDQLLEAQSASIDQAERIRLMQEALDIIADEVPYAAISYPKAIFATNKNIEYQFSASWLYNIFYKDFVFND